MVDDPHAPIMRSAEFRFYEELNDFLCRDLRKTSFSYRFNGQPSVKDTIEAIGVPHTEIDLILVNGHSVPFDHKLQGGEQVSVYPVFESFDISPLIRLRPAPLRITRFIVDVNLGKLAQKLRLLGFDTLYRRDFEDDEIVEIAGIEKRIVLTRDKGIFKYSAVSHGYWVRSMQPKEQLVEVVNRLQLEGSFAPMSRCSDCNQKLVEADKASLNGRVPPKTWQNFEQFFQCEGCEKIYWKGSHYKRIHQWIATLREESQSL
ncbi:Mut7-C RNAse domain-containing protein [Marinobacterium jannaschii]|uniref:Mut7-C RNAse domain-containing protein n=1 Tax=Marinobacterium jannaschii TaxID=64970 RepID=UPI0004874F1E|nr:Mut7-C RNAse domain-containing protein [Marinobacterium jannaschii]